MSNTLQIAFVDPIVHHNVTLSLPDHQRLPNIQSVAKTGKIYMPLAEMNKIRDKDPLRSKGTLLMHVGL